jgi:hypothetical protein
MSRGMVAFLFVRSGDAMLSVSVRTNIDAVNKSLSDVLKTQMPFAIAKALTATAKDTQAQLVAALPRQLDKPTPFTLRAFGVRPATKRSHKAVVYVKPDQWKYLRYQFDGGVRTPDKRALIVPQKLRLNKYGNMPRGAIKRLLAKQGYFSGTINGVPGIYQRKGKVTQLVAAYADKVAYKKRYPFQEIGQRAVAKTFGKNFEAALQQALSTRR